MTDIEDRPLSRGEQRRRAFLDAAAEVFAEQGYEAASVNEIVRRAGGSLATLYSQFGSKDGLFLAFVEDVTSRRRADIVHGDDHRPIEIALQDIGERFLADLLTPEARAYFMITVGEGRKFGHLMDRFWQVGPNLIRDGVAAFLLARAADLGLTLSKAEATDYAETFCVMVRGRHQYRAISDSTYLMSPDAIRAHVAYVVRLFLNGIRPR